MDYKNAAQYLLYLDTHELKDTLDKIRKEVDKKEYPLYHKVIKGCSENKRYIDTLIKHYVKKSSKLLDIEYAYFVVSIYLILFTRKKNYAVVNSVVNDIKKKRKFMGAVFNGVLRNIIRDSEQDFKDVFKHYSDKERFAIRYSINDELLDLLLDDYSLEDVRTMFAIFEDINTYAFCFDERDDIVSELRKYNIDSEVDNRLDRLIKIKTSYGIDKTRPFKEGKIYIQSFGAQAIMSPQEFDASLNVLDLCASPGGKSIALSNRIQGEILALDKSKNKVKRIEENISRLRLQNIKTYTNDATVYNPEFESTFDLVIVDAPCSATGVISKIPDIKKNRKKGDVLELVSLQRQIVENAYKYLKEDGMLLYITCSILSLENEENMNYIIEKTGLKVCTEISNMYYNKGIYKSLPHVDKEEGYFSVIFRK